MLIVISADYQSKLLWLTAWCEEISHVAADAYARGSGSPMVSCERAFFVARKGTPRECRVLHGIIIMMIMGVGATGAGFAAAEHWTVALVLLLVTAIFSGVIVASNPIRSFPDW